MPNDMRPKLSARDFLSAINNADLDGYLNGVAETTMLTSENALNIQFTIKGIIYALFHLGLIEGPTLDDAKTTPLGKLVLDQLAKGEEAK